MNMPVTKTVAAKAPEQTKTAISALWRPALLRH